MVKAARVKLVGVKQITAACVLPWFVVMLQPSVATDGGAAAAQRIGELETYTLSASARRPGKKSS